jgi:signal transduction histidine kinase
MIEEICRNAIQHGDTAGGVAAVAGLPDGHFELAVADVGIGVRESLARNPDYAYVDQGLALQTALAPGVTGDPAPARGMGLFLTRLVVAENGGVLTLRSGDAQVICTPNAITATDAPWLPGTLVVARVRTSAPFDYGRVDETLSQAAGVRS